jgi:hypothetical protein
MGARIENVQIHCLGRTRDEYQHQSGLLAALYGPLLGKERVQHGYVKAENGVLPELGFEDMAEDRPARWPDPAFPAQLHLDLGFDDDDVEAGRVRLAVLGAILLRETTHHWVWADPAGHPFCA